MAGFERPQTVGEGVHAYLRRELLEGRLPSGTWLREQELAARLEVSRTPVREALRLLAQDGLVVVEPNRGVRVPPVTVDEAVATYEVRAQLESMAAGLAARRADAAGVAALRRDLDAIDALPDDDLARHVAADDGFHGRVAALAGNAVLAELIEHLADRVRRVKVVTRDVNVTAQARVQHRAIVDAIAGGRPEAAAAAMRDHVLANLAIVRERLADRPRPHEGDRP